MSPIQKNKSQEVVRPYILSAGKDIKPCTLSSKDNDSQQYRVRVKVKLSLCLIN
jgi:hypothetical protein